MRAPLASRLRASAILIAFAFAFAIANERPARAQSEDEACFSAASTGQRARNEGHLLHAKESFQRCAHSTCDEKVRVRCVAWLSEVETLGPTIIVSAEDSAGHDVGGVRIFIDDAPIATALDGRAISVDPGVHRLRAERDGMTREQTFVLRESEKARVLRIAFPSADSTPPVGPALRPTPSLVYGLGGVAVLSLGVTTYFVASGLADRSSFGCGSSCKQNEADAVSRKLLLADVFGGVTLVAAAAATWLYLARPTSSERNVSVTATPMPSGAAATISGSF